MNRQVTEHKNLLASSPLKLTPEELGNQPFLDPGLDEPRGCLEEGRFDCNQGESAKHPWVSVSREMDLTWEM